MSTIDPSKTTTLLTSAAPPTTQATTAASTTQPPPPPTTAITTPKTTEATTIEVTTTTSVMVPVTSATQETLGPTASPTALPPLSFTMASTRNSVTSIKPTSTAASTSTAVADNSNSSASTILITTVSVIVGGLVLALLGAWVLQIILKSRRKKNDRLALNEDLNNAFPSNRPTSWYGANGNVPATETIPRAAAGIPLSRVYSETEAVAPVAAAGYALYESNNFAKTDYDLDRHNSALTSQSYGSSTPLVPPMTADPITENSLATASLQYVAARPDELTLNQGDVLEILQTFHDGWALGKNTTTNLKGMFPLNFVTPLTPKAS